MISRYVVPEPLDKKRLRNFVGLDTLTAQVPMIEIVQGKRPHCRIWTAYDYERTLGTYTAIFPSGLVTTVTVYPSGRIVSKVNRPADRKRR